jgi:hypothetical protein
MTTVYLQFESLFAGSSPVVEREIAKSLLDESIPEELEAALGSPSL